MKSSIKLFSIIVFFSLPGLFMNAAGQAIPHVDDLYIPDRDNLPEWVKIENMRFSRIDGEYHFRNQNK